MPMASSEAAWIGPVYSMYRLAYDLCDALAECSGRIAIYVAPQFPIRVAENFKVWGLIVFFGIYR